MNNAMIELTSNLLRDHIEELMHGDWEAVRNEVALCYGALYELHQQRID
tara:strand:- start:21 stop:167 length:147 start_codon:yes stop_codon:yes gene_type:complete